MYICRDCKAQYKVKVNYCECGNNTFDYIEDKPKKIKKTLTLEQKSDIVSKIFFVLCLIFSILVWLIPIGNKPVQKQTPKAEKRPITSQNIPDINKIWNDTPAYQPENRELEVINEEVIAAKKPYEYAEPIPEPVNKKPLQSNVELPEQVVKDIVKEVVKQPEPKKELITGTPKKQEVITPVELPKPVYNPNSPEMLKYKNNLRAALFEKFAVGSIQGSGECSIQFSVDKTGKLVNRKFLKESSNKSLNDTVYYMMMSVPKFTPPPDEYNGETISMNFKINYGNYEISIY